MGMGWGRQIHFLGTRVLSNYVSDILFKIVLLDHTCSPSRNYRFHILIGSGYPRKLTILSFLDMQRSLSSLELREVVPITTISASEVHIPNLDNQGKR